MMTRSGIEGGAIYALSAVLREAIRSSGQATLRIALRPDLKTPDLVARLSAPRGKQTFSNWLRKAAQLLKDAGCVIMDGKRVLPNGEHIAIEFLIDEPSFEPHHAALIKNLGTLGIDATVRIVDPVQYRARRDGFDFDITIDRFGFSATPGDSLRTFFSSQAAALKGSNNLAGIAEPAVDALIDAIIAAQTRPALTTACRALDRVIRAGRYWIPQWYKASHWIAYWDVFGRPAAQPRYFRGIPDTWWYDTGKTAKNVKPG